MGLTVLPESGEMEAPGLYLVQDDGCHHLKNPVTGIRGFLHDPQLQTLFDTMTIELDAYTNLIAERITALGGVVRGTVRTAATLSTLREYPDNIVEGNDHVCALAERFAHYARVIRDGIAHAADVEDAATANLYTDISRGVDKRLAFLEAYLHC